MKLQSFGLVAAWLLAGTLCVSAQDMNDKQKSGSQDLERAPASDAAPTEHSRDGARGEREGMPTDASERKAQEKSDQGNRRVDSEKSDRTRRHEPGQKHSDERPDRAAERSNDKSDAKSTRDAETRDRKNADRSDRDGKNDAQRKDERRTGESKNEAESKGEARKRASEKGDAGERKGEAKNVQLSGEKRDRVQSAFRSDHDLKHETKVDIDIRVGAHAPRGWAFAPIPAAVIAIVPEYRGYLVAYVEDDYVICDPDTYEIVAVLPASGGRTHASDTRGGGACAADLTLSDGDRTAILQSVRIMDEVDVSGVAVGWDVPHDIKLQAFPNPVVERVGKLGACRYFVVEDQIAIVDPDDDKVVLLLEQD